MFSRGLIVSFGVATLGFVQVVPIRPVPQAASIAAVTPTQGPIAGGTRATISGVGFSGAIVHIDGQDVTPVSLSDTAITVQMPPHDNGYAVIAVAAPGSATSYTRFLYMPPRLIDLPPGSITTVAGVGVFKGDFAAATEATVGPLNLALDSSGNIYVAEPDAYHVSRIRTDGILERFAGSGAVPNSQNCCRDGGPASQAPIGFPRGVAIDDRGGLLIADKENHRIRRVDTRTGVITTIAGTGARGFSGDGGPATAARLSSPTYVTSVEGRVYFVDFGNNRVRGIDPSGVIATVAGNGSRGFSGDGGPATDASFDLTNNPDDSGIAADRAGNLFLIDRNHRIRIADLLFGYSPTTISLRFVRWQRLLRGIVQSPLGGAQRLSLARRSTACGLVWSPGSPSTANRREGDRAPRAPVMKTFSTGQVETIRFGRAR